MIVEVGKVYVNKHSARRLLEEIAGSTAHYRTMGNLEAASMTLSEFEEWAKAEYVDPFGD